jgi:hypothetical protein
MHRRSPLAALTVFALAAAAVADEYTVTAFTVGYVAPPKIPKPADPNPQLATEIIAKRLDAQTVDVTLPFSFPFFGTVYDEISVSDDGWLAFGSTHAVQSANPTLQSTDPPNAVVAALWDRLATRKGDVVTFLKAGATTAPNRVFVVAWQHVNTSDALARDDLSFEVLLYEGTGVIEIAYSNEKSGVWNKLSYTAGIENETGTRAFGGPDTQNTNRGRPASDQRFTPNVVTVTGTITRDRPKATEARLGPDLDTNLSVVGADVVLVREDKTDASAIIARARTDANGAYSLKSYGLDGSPTFAVDLLCSGAESRVTDGSGVTYTRRIRSGIVPVEPQADPLTHLDTSVVDDDYASFRKALNIQQAAQKGYAFAQAAIDALAVDNLDLRKQFPQLEIRWAAKAPLVSGYTPASSTTAAIATISDDANNPDAYDDDVVLREYAQHLLASMAAFAGKLNAHVWAPPLNMTTVPPTATQPTASQQAAFLDGFSFWFAAAVQGRPRFVDTKLDTTTTPPTLAPTATVFDLETALDPAASSLPALVGQQIAGSVAATLWDLVDPAGDASDANDAFVGTLPETGYAVFTALDDRALAADKTLKIPTTSTVPTIASFFERFRSKLSADAAVSAARTFIAHKALDDDDDEPNDVAGDAKQVALAAQKTTGLVLNESNTDRFTFALGSTPLSIAVSFADAAEADVTIRDLVTDVAVTPAATPSTTSPIVVTTAEGQVAGTYVLQIAWKSGTAAHYSVSTFTPPSLKTPLPARWTVGLPFNQALKLQGGVAPGTFSLASGAVPGLSVQSAGTSYVGTPTTIGHYPLTFSVTDASGAGPQLLAPISLDVLEGLTLPSVFGVASKKPVSVDLGRGGVDPTWTLTESAPTPGFTVTVGETLHFEGSSNDAAAFTVTASAVDAALNASLASKSSRVVVCPAFDAARDSSPNAATAFGYWFDAIGGSRVTLGVRFSGADAPPFRTLVDDRGTPIQLGDDVLALTGSSLRIRNLVVPRTARYFLVFDASPTFKGRVAAATLRVLPPRRASHVGNIATDGATVETRFTAIAGSRATITVRSGLVPKPPLPGAVTLLGPDGKSVDLGSARFASGGGRTTFVGVPLAEHGEYVLTFGAAELAPGDVRHSTTGPLIVEVVIVPPKRTPFSVD